MNSHRNLLILTLGILAAALAACSASQATPTAEPAVGSPEVTESGPVPQDLVRTDEQGEVSVVVTPLNLNDPEETVDFDVMMNTHSVELDMDLASLATLSTDTGLVLSPVAWDAPRGGHHVQGTLSFEANLDGVTQLTLVIRDVGVPERVFVWDLSG